MERKLSSKEREKLILRHRTERVAKIRDRIKAVLAHDDGYGYSEIARILLVDDETVRRHIEKYFKHNQLKPKSGGSKSYLNQSETAELKSHLSENIYLYVKDICSYVKATYKKSYSVSGMTKWLCSNGFRYKKPHAVPAKANKEQQEVFIEMYEKLKKEAGESEPIYFADSVHPQHQTRLSYGWILKGERKAIATTARQKRLSFMGGISIQDHKVVYEQSETVNAVTIQTFLKKLRNAYPNNNKIHIIWDNAGYHRSKDVVKYAEKLNMDLHYLPPYSPNLNPIERLWKLMHEQTTYNKYHETFLDFTEAIKHFFRNISKKKKILRSRITDNFQELVEYDFAF